MRAQPQRLADRYELERELTNDHEAANWLARDSALDRRVVVRLLRPELVGDAGAADHFWQAARAAASSMSLDEPRLLDGGTDAATGQLFVVREWRGESDHEVDDDEQVAWGTDRSTPRHVVPRVTPGVTASVGEAPHVTPGVTVGGGDLPRVTPRVTGSAGEAPHVTPGVTIGGGDLPRVTPGVTDRPYAGGRRRGMAGPAASGGVEQVAGMGAASAGIAGRSVRERLLPARRLSQGRVVAVGLGLGLVLALAVGGWLVGAGAGAWLAWVNEPLGRPAPNVTLAPPVGAPAGSATRAAGTVPPTLAAAPRQSSVESTPAATATDTRPAGEPRVVVNTDGLGVALRVSPGGDRQPGRGYAEGAVVTFFEQQGEWARIRGADGREGWVLALTLAPTAGAQPADTPARPTGTPAAAPAAAAAAPGAPAAPAGVAAAATPPAAAANGRQRVVNTDGQGVALRAAPNGARLPGRGYPEGTTVSVLERSGAWTHIRGDDGREGWVPSVTLAPL